MHACSWRRCAATSAAAKRPTSTTHAAAGLSSWMCAPPVPPAHPRTSYEQAEHVEHIEQASTRFAACTLRLRACQCALRWCCRCLPPEAVQCGGFSRAGLGFKVYGLPRGSATFRVFPAGPLPCIWPAHAHCTEHAPLQLHGSAAPALSGQPPAAADDEGKFRSGHVGANGGLREGAGTVHA